MKKPDKREAKKRIFNAAVDLFVQKGYHAVGTREIARTAGVNMAMIHYYYGEKANILKAIIDAALQEYYRVVISVYEQKIPPYDRVRMIIKDLIAFFRNNRKLALVAFNLMPFDIPEIIDFRLDWVSAHREKMDRHFTEMGLDTEDVVQMNVIRGVVTTLVLAHFQHEYMWENIKHSAGKSETARKIIRKDTKMNCSIDDYYEKYAEGLTTLYLYGVHGLTSTKNNKRRKKIKSVPK